LRGGAGCASFAMMRLARTTAPLLLLALAQCAGDMLPPFETVPPRLTGAEQHAAIADGDAARVAVCYNALTTTAERVRAIAAESCAAGTTPRALARDFSLNNCPLLQPARATFACLKS
jgi:hypothetical protein